MEKILILVSSSGGGHIAAGNNIKQALGLLNSDLDIRVVDSYDFIHPFKKWQYTKGWQLWTRYAPGLYRYLRDRSVKSPWMVKNLRRGFRPGAKNLAKYLEQEFKAKTIITTHAHAAGLVSILKEPPYKKDLYLAQVYTDFQFHAFYQSKQVDHYFAPAEWVAVQLRKSGSQAKVTASGAPIHPCFGIELDKTSLRKKIGIPLDDKPVVLVSRGSFGWGNKKNLEIVRLLASSNLPIHVIANAGKNIELAEQMYKITKENQKDRSTLRVLGWVNNMYEFMALADVYVGKPGGMQVAESLSQGTPLLVFDPIPGQEDANVKFILEQKAGSLIKEPSEVIKWLKKILTNKSLLWSYKKQASILGSKEGSVAIAKEVLIDNGITVNRDINLKTCLPGPPSTK